MACVALSADVVLMILCPVGIVLEIANRLISGNVPAKK
jgi:hypothetical protein